MKDLKFRVAEEKDIATIIDLLIDDQLGSARERVAGRSMDSYQQAFDQISQDKNNHLILAEEEGEIVGTFQLTFIPSLTHHGGKRAQIEGVRVKAPHRGQGIGRRMFQWAIDRSIREGCRLLQLTSDKRRTEAHEFYASLGFQATHEGYKLRIEEDFANGSVAQ